MKHNKLRQQINGMGLDCGVREGTYNGTACLFLHKDGAEDVFTGIDDYADPVDVQRQTDYLKWKYGNGPEPKW